MSWPSETPTISVCLPVHGSMKATPSAVSTTMKACTEFDPRSSLSVAGSKPSMRRSPDAGNSAE
ncbi:hypothetical protein ACFSKM_26200 [Ancylobacter dichloromethanicus]